MNMYKFPSINSFASIVDDMRELDFPLGKVVRFVGTVKLHGSNGGIVQPSAGAPLVAQSRNRVLSIEEDNMDFAQYVQDTQALWQEKFAALRATHEVAADHLIIAYGEWVGHRINPKVAIGKLPDRRLLTFAFLILSPAQAEMAGTIDFRRVGRWIFADTDLGGFPTYEIDIDFDDPQAAVEPLKAMTIAVEERCPVAAELGIDGMGEGIVWRPVGVDVHPYRFAFKAKGEKHKKGTGVPKKVALAPEVVESIRALVDVACNEERLLQGWAYLEEMQHPLEKRSIPVFLKWVMSDISREEAGMIKASGLPSKNVLRSCSSRAKTWFFNKVESF